MLALIIVAHPSTDSYCHDLAAAAEAGLRAADHEVVVLDLYALGFQVAMTAAEREAYHGDAPILDPMVAEHAALVQRADAIVFVYPTWWSGLPAILKGWLERVLVPGVGFILDERTNKVRPGLGQMRRLVGISTYGSPRSYVRLINDNGRRIVTRALRMSCGLRVRTTWLGLYAIDTSTPAQRDEFLARVERQMAELR
ncbi:MAG TPA: NAD(P)H-dependent oxidoreductase [Ilumatobacteraceae bacterium]|nr:NAD(P)H-dependent oxidoreductase [Ilumatobacteraceae bacterium]